MEVEREIKRLKKKAAGHRAKAEQLEKLAMRIAEKHGSQASKKEEAEEDA